MKISLSIIFALSILTAGLSCSPDPQKVVEELLKNGQAHYDSGRYQEAVYEWEQALEFDPAISSVVIFQMAIAQRGVGDFDQSTEILRQLIGREERVVEAYLMIAQNQVMSGQYEDAKNTCTTIENIAPNDCRLKITAGHIETLLGRYPEGETFYREAIEIDDNRSDAYFHLAANLISQNNRDLADEYYKKALNLGPADTKVFLMNKARFLSLRGDDEGTEKAFLSALEKDPDNIYLQLKIAHLFLSAGQYNQLIEFFSRIEEVTQQHPIIQKLLVDTLMNTGRLNEAYEILILADHPKTYDWLLLKGKYHLLKGEATVAVSYLEGAMTQRADDPKGLNLLAMAYLASDKVNLANQTWIKLLALAPQTTDAEIGIADLHYKKEHYDLSVNHLKRIISNAPEQYRARMVLGHCMRAMGRIQEAQASYGKAQTLKPDSLSVLYYLGVVSESAGDDNTAIQIYRAVLEKNSELADAALRLAHLQIHNQRLDETRTFFSALSQQQPANGYLEFILGDIEKSSLNFSEAVGHYKLALERNPRLLKAYLKLVEMEPDNNRKISIINDALINAPDAVDLKMAISILYYKGNDISSAVSVMKDIHKKYPGNPVFANNLAWLYLEGDMEPESAYELSRFAYGKDSSNPNYAHTLGWACYKKGLFKEAEWHLREAIDSLESQPKLDDKNLVQQSIFSYYLACFLLDTKPSKEGKELLRSAIDSGLPDKYLHAARKLLDGR